MRFRHKRATARSFLSLFAMLSTLCCSLSSAQASDCLFGTAACVAAPDPSQCVADPLGLQNTPGVKAAIQAYGISSAKITMTGCRGGCFSTEPHDGPLGRSYVIYYPTGIKTPDSNLEVTADYIGPMTHELAHVFQVELAGSKDSLEQQLSTKRIELGADFLAGVAFQNYLALEQNDFEHSLSLIGSYKPNDQTDHGKPSERTSAFRAGFHLSYAQYRRSMARANTQFQRDLFGTIDDGAGGARAP